MGLPRQWSRSRLSGTTSGLDDGRTRVVHEITEWCMHGAQEVHEYEWCTSMSCARVVHESSAQEYYEWCMIVHEKGHVISTSGA